MKKRVLAVVLCMLCVVSLCSCSLLTKKYSYTPEAGSIFVHEDGQITAAIVEDFDKDYYDINELTTLAKDLVKEYNERYYGSAYAYYSYEQLTSEQKKQTLLPISLESVTQSGKQVILVLKYMNGDTYTGFNSIDIANANGTKVYTSAANASAVALPATVVSAQGGKVQAIDSIVSKSDYKVVYVDFATKINFEHEIAYVSDNVYVSSTNAVQTVDGQGSFIIFK